MTGRITHQYQVSDHTCMLPGKIKKRKGFPAAQNRRSQALRETADISYRNNTENTRAQLTLTSTPPSPPTASGVAIYINRRGGKGELAAR